MLRIKEIRKQLGITARQVAEHINVAESTMSLYESGKREPDIETIVNLAKYFNVTLEYLLGVGDTPTEEERRVLDVTKTVQESEECEEKRKKTLAELQPYLTCDEKEKPADEGELEEEYSEQERALISAFRRADEEGKLRIIQISMNLADEAEKKSNTANKRNA